MPNYLQVQNKYNPIHLNTGRPIHIPLFSMLAQSTCKYRHFYCQVRISLPLYPYHLHSPCPHGGPHLQSKTTDVLGISEHSRYYMFAATASIISSWLSSDRSQFFATAKLSTPQPIPQAPIWLNDYP